ncbi:hypothetical protein [uncultured Roseobacter sp.]|uniref:hypothetical protein n=1 Tax=uncultured Roseobacter sp. TaxID=114847 RepID=UPI0026291835|nr:hypothetical protein [uncultured Roseobacter sp.]
MFDNIHEAHSVLVRETRKAAKPGHNPVPVSLVSVNETVDGQLVIFDGFVVSPASVVKRLRAAADHIENQQN